MRKGSHDHGVKVVICKAYLSFLVARIVSDTVKVCQQVGIFRDHLDVPSSNTSVCHQYPPSFSSITSSISELKHSGQLS